MDQCQKCGFGLRVGKKPQVAKRSESQGHGHQQVPGSSLTKHLAQHQLLTAMS